MNDETHVDVVAKIMASIRVLPEPLKSKINRLVVKTQFKLLIMEAMKQAIKELVAKQIKAKSDRKSNDYKTRTYADYQVKKNRDELFVMYVTYFILKHNLISNSEDYIKSILNHAKWLSGWNGFGLYPYDSESDISETYLGKAFINSVNSLVNKYAGEIIRSDRLES